MSITDSRIMNTTNSNMEHRLNAKELLVHEIDNAAAKGATSLTYLHILSVIRSKLKNYRYDSTIRILDVGCGNGNLIAYLQTYLQLYYTNVYFDIYGFEVSDSKVQFDGFMLETIEMLSNTHDSTGTCQPVLDT